MKEILQDKEIRMCLYKEFEEIMCSKFNLNKEIKKGKKSEEINELKISEFNKRLKNIEEQINIKTNDLINIKSRLDNINKMERDFNSKIEKNIRNNQLIKNISESIDLMKNNMKNNYIEMIIYNDKKKKKKIKILQQNRTYKYLYNFKEMILKF